MQPKFTQQKLRDFCTKLATMFVLLAVFNLQTSAQNLPSGSTKSSKNLKEQLKAIQNLPTSAGPAPTMPEGLISNRNGVQPDNPNPASRGFAYSVLGIGASQLAKQTLLNTTLTNIGGVVPFQFPGAAVWNTSNNKMYVVDQLSPFGLYTVDTSTGVRTFLVNCTGVPQANLTGMTWDATTNTMYGASTSITQSSIFTINLSTGVCTPIGAPTSVAPGVIMLNAALSGTLFSVDIVNDALYRWNKATGVPTLVGPLGFNANFGQDGAFDPSDGQYYYACYNLSAGGPQLRILDTTNGSSTLIGSYAVTQIGTLAIYSAVTPCSGTPNPGNTLTSSTAPTLLPNGGFETGTFAPWVVQATNPSPAVTSTNPHTGSYAAFLGNTPGPEPFGDCSFFQPFTVPASGGVLSFWYQPFSQDGITFDWQDAYITDATGTTKLATIMHVCQTGGYTNVTYNLSAFAGQNIGVKFLVHQDGFGDVTNMYVDDVTLLTMTNMVCMGQNFTLTMSNPPVGFSGYTYQWQSSSNNVTYTDIPGATGVSYTTSFSSPTWYRVKVTCTNSGLSANSNPIQMIDGQGVFTSQPANATAQCSGGTSFSFAATGLTLSYRWEYRVNGSSPWLAITDGGAGCNAATIAGSQTNTLTLTNVPSSWNGYQFRAYMFGTCTAPDYTSAATLTVTPLVATVNPVSATICNGTIQKLTLTNPVGPQLGEGFDVAVPLPSGWAKQNNSQPIGTTGWMQGPYSDLGITITAHSGASSSFIQSNFGAVDANGGNLSNWLMTPVLNLHNGDVFTFWTRTLDGSYPDELQVRISTNGASTNVGATSASVGDFTTMLLDINPGLTGTGYPIVWTPYTLTMSGLPAGATPGRIAFRHYVIGANMPPNYPGEVVAIDDVSYGGVSFGTWTSSPGSPNTMFTDPGATIAYTGVLANSIWVKPSVNTTYCVTYATNCPSCTSNPTCIPVNVTQPISNFVNPTNKSVCVGSTATFTVGSGGGPLTYQWYESSDGGVTYHTIGGSTATLTLPNVVQTMNNYLYYVTVTAAPCGSQTSPVVKLTVNPLPIVNITATNLQLTPGQTSTLSATSTPAATAYAWYLNGSAITPPATASSTVANIDGLGVYYVSVTDVNGCVNTSNNLVIGAKQSDRLWIYPNPTTGQFQVRYYYGGAIAEKRDVRIFDMTGRLVFKKAFGLASTTYPYLEMDFNQTGLLPAGTYVVKVFDQYENHKASGLLVVQ
jgi:hypothetical protein